jgi:choline transporter-like protein 2/4/5
MLYWFVKIISIINRYKNIRILDIPCCILFTIFISCFVILSIFAFIEGNYEIYIFKILFEIILGNPKQLVNPTDSQGNLCGSGKFVNQPYAYFFDWTKCIHAVNIPVNMLQGRPFVCPTTQVCVEQCPNQTSYYKFPNYHANRVCTYDVDPSPVEDYEPLVKAGKCAAYIIASKPLFGRCLPEHLQRLANSIIHVGNETVYDSDGQPLNGSKLEQVGEKTS